ncbi:hypothetical protein ACTXPC_15535 [Brachybacterium alimentarium]|uniref:hypothetical protein n=1 Tax=Brachybacterium alimentarium TaxID=47845 RepID=UPI0015F1220F|nr:hypothetical protein [Brachybacterium alimentarium]
MADPTEEEEAQATEAGNQATAEFICGTVLKLEAVKSLNESCVGKAKSAVESLPSIEDVDPGVICPALLVLGPAVGATCAIAISDAAQPIRDAFKTAYDNTIGETVDKVVGAAKFIADPQSSFEDIVNTVRDGAVDIMNQVMGELVNIGNPDFTAEWWRNSYAAAGGIGVFVAAIMSLLLTRLAAADEISSSQFAEGLQYLVAGLISMVWAPVIAYVVQDVITTFNKGIVDWGGEDLYKVILDGAIFQLTAPMIPGGILMGLVFFLLLFLAAVMVFVMFIAQGLAVYITAIAMAIGFGMLAHPKWRSKGLKIPMLVLGIMLAKPLLLFIMTVLFKMIESFDPLSLLGSSALQALGEGCIVILSLLLVGLAPWTAFRFMPLLPSGSEIDGGQMNPAGSAASGAAGMMMMSMSMKRMQSGGGGGSGGGESTGGSGSASSSSSSEGESSTGSSSSPTGGSDPTESTTGGAGGAGDAAGAAKSASSAAGGASGGAGGAAGSAGGASGGAGGAAGGAGGAAGGAGGAAGGAGGAVGGGGALAGGAVTGGGLLVAAAAAKVAGGAAQAGKQAAQSAAPAQQADSNEESQSNLHDRRGWSE